MGQVGDPAEAPVPENLPAAGAVSAGPADAEYGFIRHMPKKWRPYLQLMRIDRPIGTWLLFLPCVFGLILGAASQSRPFGTPHDLWYVLLMAVGAIVMRGAGCTYNDIVDRNIDAAVARTRGRPIPSGAVSLHAAWLFVGAQCLVGLIVLLQFNLLAIQLGFGAVILVAAYPFMKRITWWPQAWLGLTFNWGAVLGFAAVTGTIDAGDLMLYAGLIFWTLGYDTIYAHQDKEDDALVGVKSTARRLGAQSRRWIGVFYTLSFALVLAAGFTEHAGWPFGILLLLAGGHMYWQVQHLDIDDSGQCLRLFRSNRDAGGLIVLALLVSSWVG